MQRTPLPNTFTLFIYIAYAFFSPSAMSASNQIEEKPARIVSLNLCSDELVLLLAEPERIASVTYLATDPAYSPVHTLANSIESLTFNHGLAEEVVQLQPDLILNTEFSAIQASRMLKTLGYDLTLLDIPSSLDASINQIRRVAALVGENEKGETLINQIEQQAHDAKQQLSNAPSHSALFLSSNGLTYGRFTLQDDFLSSIGWTNVASEAGINGPAKIDLETLLQSRPDYLFINTPSSNEHLLAHPLLQHQAVRRYFSEQNTLVLVDSLFQCAGPSYAQAYSLLVTELERTKQ